MYIIAFDADDTLWDNEVFFRESEKCICQLLSSYASQEDVMSVFYDTEINNIPIYGFGVKNLILSAVETAGKISNGSVPFSVISQIINVGREQLVKPVSLLPNVLQTLQTLQRLNLPAQIIIATKGDLLDQERKIDLSGLRSYFNRSFIMCDKQKSNYKDIINQLQCSPENFIMIGNSLKSDVLPILQLGGKAIHIPYKTTWQHEVIDTHLLDDFRDNMYSVADISDIIPILKNLILN